MYRTLLALALAAVCPAPAAAQPAASPADADIDEGIRLVETGDFERGIVVLDGAVRKLPGAEHSGARARAYLHLGIAYLGLAQVEAAKDRFRAALTEAGDLTLSTDQFPPPVVDLFDETRRELAARRAAGLGPLSGVAVGARLRLRSNDTGMVRGTLLSMDRATLVLAGDGGGRITVGRDSITHLEMSVGSERQTLWGLLIGAGLGLSVVISPIDPDDCGTFSVSYCSRSDAIGTGIAVAALGAFVGWAIRSDRWAPVALDVSGTPPASGGSGEVRVALRLRF
jgi:hypothetical protein